MKKILLVHHSGSIGGAGVSLLHIIRSIDTDKYKVVVLCPENPNNMACLLEKEDCEVVTSKSSPVIFNHYNGGISHAVSIQSIKNYFSIKSDVKNIKNYINEIEPDIVAVNSMTLFWIGKIAKKMGKKTICFHRETYQKGLFGFRSRKIKRGLSKWFDKIAFISKNDLIETGQTKARKFIIYDRVDLSQFNKYSKKEARNQLGFKDEYKYLLFLGGISRLKGTHILFEAMNYLDDDIKLVFLSNEDFSNKRPEYKFKNIQKLVKYTFRIGIKEEVSAIYHNNLEDKIIFLRKTSNPEVLYKACDLVVFPSTKPHQSRPIYESGISKVPILISDFPQTSEFAEDGVTAITFEPNNSKSLAKKINYIFNNSSKIEKIVDQNYQQTVENHSLETLKDDLDKLFKFE